MYNNFALLLYFLMKKRLQTRFLAEPSGLFKCKPVYLQVQTSGNIIWSKSWRTTVHYVRFQILTAASMKMTVFWDVAPCNLKEVYRRFRSACFLPRKGTLLPDYMAQYPTKHYNVQCILEYMSALYSSHYFLITSFHTLNTSAEILSPYHANLKMLT
jgi:hypothetical protein